MLLVREQSAPTSKTPTFTMDFRGTPHDKPRNTMPSSRGITHRIIVNTGSGQGPDGLSSSTKMMAEDSHCVEDEEEGKFLIKIERFDEYEEQGENHEYDGFEDDDMKVEIKEEDLPWKEASDVTRSDQVHCTKRSRQDTTARPTLQEHKDGLVPPHHSAQPLNQGPIQQKLDNVSAPSRERESQQLSPTVLAALDIKSDDRNLYTESAEEKNMCQLHENISNQGTCTTSPIESLVPTLKPPWFPHGPMPLTPSPPESESQAPRWSCTQAEKGQAQQYEEAIILALNMASKDNALPTYPHCVARAIEAILDECPEDKQLICGQRILTAAIKIQMEIQDLTI